jgi:hypothetical protein
VPTCCPDVRRFLQLDKPDEVFGTHREMQGDFVRKQGKQRPITAESHSISTRWTSFSLMRRAGRILVITGKEWKLDRWLEASALRANAHLSSGWIDAPKVRQPTSLERQRRSADVSAKTHIQIPLLSSAVPNSGDQFTSQFRYSRRHPAPQGRDAPSR